MHELLKRWVDTNKSEFEYALLWLATNDTEMWQKLSRVVCRDSSGKPVNDFVVPLHNAYYEVVAAARAQAPTEPSVGRMLFCTMLMAMSVKGERVGRADSSGVMDLYDILAATDYRQMTTMIKTSLPYWLNKQRANSTMLREVSSTNWDANNLLQVLSKEISYNNSQLEEDDHVSEAIMQIMTQKLPPKGLCMSTGLLRLDTALGGGFYKGDANLVIAAPGVGKTVFATQMALNAALHKNMVVLISTEQPMDQLTPRWLSNWCEYDFGLVTRGFDVQLLDRLVQEKLMKLAHLIRKRIYVFDWKKKKKSVLGGGIEEEIAIAERMSGLPCSMVILDWLGGGLTDDVKDDKDKKRMALQNTADRLAEIASERKICAVALAQAHKVKGVNNMFVGIAEVPENKTLDQSMTTVTGITGLFNEKTKDAIRSGQSPDGHALYAPEQFFFVSKARMSKGGHAATRRKFKYQKFVDPN